MYSTENVMKIAGTAKIKIDGDEARNISGVLTARNEYLIREMNNCPAQGCDPDNLTRQKNIFREDVLEESLSNEKALSGAKGRDGFFYLAKRQ